MSKIAQELLQLRKKLPKVIKILACSECFSSREKLNGSVNMGEPALGRFDEAAQTLVNWNGSKLKPGFVSYPKKIEALVKPHCNL